MYKLKLRQLTKPKFLRKKKDNKEIKPCSTATEYLASFKKYSRQDLELLSCSVDFNKMTKQAILGRLIGLCLQESNMFGVELALYYPELDFSTEVLPFYDMAVHFGCEKSATMFRRDFLLI